MPKTRKANRWIQRCGIFFFYAMVGCSAFGQMGCPDPQAINYDPGAVINDGTCQYQALTITPASTYSLASGLNETSGLLIHEGQLLTHNDDSDDQLYVLNAADGSISATVPLDGLTNIDWEDLAQDDDYFYLGDFGNNENGNRQNLRIYKILKASLTASTIQVDTLHFTYEDQVDFSGTGSNQTDFDCEAMISVGDSLYLFTKQWVSEGSTIYAVPKTPGNHIAQKRSEQSGLGWITGATVARNDSVIILSGYVIPSLPFIYLLYDYSAFDFFSGNVRKINVNAQYHQIEGIASSDGDKVYLTNEHFNQFTVNVDPKLMVLNLGDLIGPYYDYSLTAGLSDNTEPSFAIYPNPVEDKLTVNGLDSEETVEIWSLTGEKIWSEKPHHSSIELSFLPAGLYFIKIRNETFKLQKT